MSYLREHHFSPEAFEVTRNHGIHALSPEGFEEYFSPDGYNYHYLKKNKDPQILAEIAFENELKKKGMTLQEYLEQKAYEQIMQQNQQNQAPVEQPIENVVENNNKPIEAKPAKKKAAPKKQENKFDPRQHMLPNNKKVENKNPSLAPKKQAIASKKSPQSKLVQVEKSLTATKPIIRVINENARVGKKTAALNK